MIRLDTINIQADYSCIDSFDKNSLLVEPIDRGKIHEGRIKVYHIDKCRPGANKSYLTEYGKVNLSLSAKVLADNMLEGINQNTIEQALNNFNQASPLKVKINDVLDYGKLRTCDSTQMINPDYSIDDCINALMLFRTNRDYNAWPFRTRQKGTGIVIESKKNKLIKRRFIAYCKYVELSRNTLANREFFASCSNPLKVLNSTKNMLRCELNSTGFKNIRERFHVEEPYLKSVLETGKKVNYDFLKKASIGNESIDLFQESMSELTVHECIFKNGLIPTAEIYNRDIELIKIWLRTKYKGRTSVYRTLKVFEDTIRQLNEQDITKVNKEFKGDVIINHLLELIKVA